MMPYTMCAACDEEVYIPGKPTLGQTVVCSDCNAELEVISVNPLELDWPEEDEGNYGEDE